MKKLITACLMLLSAGVQAREYRPSSTKDFDRLLDKNELALAMFYREERNEKVKRLKEDVKRVSRGVPEVAFITINLDKNRLAELANTYGIKTVPLFMLFRDGRQVKDQGQAATKSGFLYRQSILNFIDDYLGDDIDDIREQKRKDAERRAERARLSWGPYWGWGYPYYPYYGYGYGPYYGGSGMYFGFGI